MCTALIIYTETSFRVSPRQIGKKLPDYTGHQDVSVPGFMVVSALRYSYGRGTYITRWTQDWIEDNWSELPRYVQEGVLSDLKWNIDVHRDIGDGKGPIRGEDIDRWRYLYNKWTEEMGAEPDAPALPFKESDFDFDTLRETLRRYDTGTGPESEDALADIKSSAVETARELNRVKNAYGPDYPVMP